MQREIAKHGLYLSVSVKN